jgi:hypothetical protein
MHFSEITKGTDCEISPFVSDCNPQTLSWMPDDILLQSEKTVFLRNKAYQSPTAIAPKSYKLGAHRAHLCKPG